MSRVRNADDFLLRFREIRKAYEDRIAPRIAKIRADYNGKPEEGFVDQSLEAHVRAYVVNALLAALNWRLDQSPEDGLPNLFPEAPVRSQVSRNIRFLDYLGLECQTDKPLLIVETKRPNAELPRTLDPTVTHSEAICRGLVGEPLSGEWNKWIQTLKDYVRSVYEQTKIVPRRVVITNGDWLIVFLDPSDAFLSESRKTGILICVNRSDIENRYHELYKQLEHSGVLGETSPLNLGELPFYIEASAVERVMHGLRLRYTELHGIYQRSPIIKVAPVVFLRSRYGALLRVEMPPQEFELPHKPDQLLQHLHEVDQAAKHLFDEVNHRLGTSLQPFPLSRHYDDEEAFQALHGVAECLDNEYLLITGNKTHYILPTPTISDCPYHDWATCNRRNVASHPGPIMARSISPRSFFMSSEIHHCAHRDVHSAKATPITSTIRPRCGRRSGHDGQAFCEIWRFEQHLCCRACSFEEVCTKTTVFQPPC